MSSLEIENVVLTGPSGTALDQRVREIDVDKVTCIDAVVTGTFNGQAIVGTLVFTGSTQLLTNKSLDDSTTAVVDTADPSIKVAIDAAGGSGTTAVLKFVQGANRTYTVPDSGADCDVVMTEGAQSINGVKTFSSLAISEIDEATPDTGVTIDNIRLREDALIGPAACASISAVGSGSDITMSLIPKGAGAITAAFPDGLATGGDIRGDYAVDLQMQRSSSLDVASGAGSAILGGASNRAAGDYSIAAGLRAQAQHNGSFVFADSTNVSLSSTTTDQFRTRFAGGYSFTGGPCAWNVETLRDDASAQTVGAVTADLYTIPTSASTSYMLTFEILAATAAGDTGVFTGTQKAKNISGILSVGTAFDTWDDLDGAISTASVSFVQSGTNIVVRALGVAGQTINWAGSLRVKYLAF